MPDINESTKTKDRILFEATNLFAQKGYAAVSVRDIGDSVNIKAASIYNHFQSKEVLWEESLEYIKNLYLLYFKRLEVALPQTKCFEEVLDCMFTELLNVVHIFNYYGFCIIQSEHFRDEKVYKIFSEVYLKYSIDFIKDAFDTCIERGFARPFDTRATATMFMHTVLIGTGLRFHESMNHPMPYDINEMYTSLKNLIITIANAA